MVNTGCAETITLVFKEQPTAPSGLIFLRSVKV